MPHYEPIFHDRLKLCSFREPLTVLPPATTTFQFLVRVSDSGTPSKEDLCDLIIRLFDISWTVNVTINGPITTNSTLERLLHDFLGLDIVTTRILQLNSTHYEIQFYGKNVTQVIGSDELTRLISNLTAEQRDLLMQAGIRITGVVSNRPVQPPSRIPTPSIPAWAVVVIVILNSVIIIAVLVIILVLLLRSLRE